MRTRRGGRRATGGAGAGAARVVAVLAALVLSGCLGRSPEPAFYALVPLAPAAATPATDAPGPAVAVGPVRLPRHLDRAPLVTLREGGRLQIHEFHRWAAGLETQMTQVLGANLARLLPSDRVSVYPEPSPWPQHARVRVDVEQLEARRGEAVVLEARWILERPGADDAVAEAHRTRLEAPVESDDMDALVAAHGRVALALAEEIAAALRSGGASRP